MGIDPQLQESMQVHTIFVARYFSVSDHGDPIYSEPVETTARVERRSTVVQLANGEQRNSDTMIYALMEIGELDRIWLPSDDPEDSSKARMPQRVTPIVGEVGEDHHWEIQL